MRLLHVELLAILPWQPPLIDKLCWFWWFCTMHVGFLNISMFVRNRSLPGPRFRLPELRGTLKAAVVFFFSYDQYLRQRRLQHTWQSTVVPPLWCNVRPWNKVILLLQRRRVLNRCLVGRRRRTVRLGWRSSCREKVAHKVPTSFPKDLSWLFGISWYRLQYWWAIPGNVKNCTVAISRRYVKLYDLAKIQDFHAKVAWFCTRNSTLRFQGISFLRCRLLMFGACFLT